MSLVRSPEYPSLSILIVEDDNTARDIIVRMSAKEFPDCSIHSAENGELGVQRYRELSPDLVITDVRMPLLDGIAMARAIRSLDAQAKFIVVTAFSDHASYLKFQEIGVCAYLLKPLDFMELFAAIEKCAAQNRARRPA